MSFVILSDAADIVNAFATADMPRASFGQSNKLYYFTLPVLFYLPPFSSSILLRTTVPKAGSISLYSRHGLAVGSNASGGIYTSSNYIHALEQSACATANSFATTATAPVAYYATTR